jgi:transcriptional regulator with XRE-family HTH domain
MSKKESKSSKRVPPEAKTIGANLRKLRKEAGLSQQKLGRVLGVSFQQLQKYETGRNRLPVDRLYTLKHFFDVPYECFLTGLGSLKPAKNLYGHALCEEPENPPDMKGKL